MASRMGFPHRVSAQLGAGSAGKERSCALARSRPPAAVKTDLVSAQELEEVRQRIRTINAQAMLHETQN